MFAEDLRKRADYGIGAPPASRVRGFERRRVAPAPLDRPRNDEKSRVLFLDRLLSSFIGFSRHFGPPDDDKSREKPETCERESAFSVAPSTTLGSCRRSAIRGQVRTRSGGPNESRASL